MKWKFRSTWNGKQILQIKDRLPANSVGDFTYFWKDADKDDIIDFTVEMKMLMGKIEIVNKMKNEHPEYFLVN
jgi:hypothetical protein